MNTLILLVALIPADADSNARVAVALSLAIKPAAAIPVNPCGVVGCDCGCAKGLPCRCGYDAAYKKAKADDKPLIVWVRQSNRAVPGCVTCRWDGFPDAGDEPCVVVAHPFDTWLATVPGKPPDDEILAVLKPPAARLAFSYTPAPVGITEIPTYQFQPSSFVPRSSLSRGGC